MGDGSSAGHQRCLALRRSLCAQSKQHVSFWDLTLSDTRWQEVKTSACDDLQQPQKAEAKGVLAQQFHAASDLAKMRFACDDFAEIVDGKLKLKRYDKIVLPPSVTTLQKVINSRLPLIRIEQLLMEVDHLTGFSRHFTPVQAHQSGRRISIKRSWPP